MAETDSAHQSANESVPFGRKLSDAVLEVKAKYGPHVEAHVSGFMQDAWVRLEPLLKLRDDDALGPTIAETLQQGRALAPLQLTPMAAGAAAVVALRALGELDRLCDVAVAEVLQCRSWTARWALVLAVAPGWLCAVHCRRQLASQVSSDWTLLPGGAASEEHVGANALRVAQRLPPTVWVTAVLSGTVVMQMAKYILAGCIRTGFHLRLRTLLFLTVAAAAARKAGRDGMDALLQQLAAHLQAVRRSAGPALAKLKDQASRRPSPEAVVDS